MLNQKGKDYFRQMDIAQQKQNRFSPITSLNGPFLKYKKCNIYYQLDLVSKSASSYETPVIFFYLLLFFAQTEAIKNKNWLLQLSPI